MISILVLQHPRENRHPLTTVPLLQELLPSVEVLVGLRFSPSEIRTFAPEGSVLVFPDTEALKQKTEFPYTLTPSGLKPTRLIFIDGTWGQAKSLLHSNPLLKTLPKLTLHPKNLSLYQSLRKESKSAHLSLFESAILALEACDPGQVSINNAMSLFERWVKSHVQPKAPPKRRSRPKRL